MDRTVIWILNKNQPPSLGEYSKGGEGMGKDKDLGIIEENNKTIVISYN